MQVRHGTGVLLATSRDAKKDAALLLCCVLGKDRAWTLTHPDVPLTAAQIDRYQGLLARRARHEPIQYILGQQEFYGLRFSVTPDVLIPRPETEALIEAVLERLPQRKPARIVDVGTGSGAITVTLAAHRPLAEITALDLSPAALQVARTNAEAHGVAGRIRFVESDLLAALPGEHFDMIVSNPPYIPDGELLEQQVQDWEPALALRAGKQGLSIYERLIPQASRAILPEGWLLLEIGYGQQAPVAALLAGWRDVEFAEDLQGIPRVAIAQKA